MRDTTVSELERLSAATAAIDAAEVVFEMDEEAFRAFYDRTSRTLWSYLLRVTGSRPLADDLMQETYYRFLRAARTYEGDAHRRNSLFHIATNLVRDNYRRRSYVELPDAGVTPELQSDGDLADRTARRTDLERAMAHLKPRERAM